MVELRVILQCTAGYSYGKTMAHYFSDNLTIDSVQLIINCRQSGPLLILLNILSSYYSIVIFPVFQTVYNTRVAIYFLKINMTSYTTIYPST